MICCPTCDREMPEDTFPLKGLYDIPLAPMMRRVLNIILDAYPRRVMSIHMQAMLWDHDPNGGPIHQGDIVRTNMCRLRKILPQYGWTIPNVRESGAYNGGYKVTPTHEGGAL